MIIIMATRSYITHKRSWVRIGILLAAILLIGVVALSVIFFIR